MVSCILYVTLYPALLWTRDRIAAKTEIKKTRCANMDMVMHGMGGTQPEFADKTAINHLFLISVAQPSIPSPLLPTGISRATVSIPLVPLVNSELLIPPAFARASGGSSNIGIKKSAILFASSGEK